MKDEGEKTRIAASTLWGGMSLPVQKSSNASFNLVTKPLLQASLLLPRARATGAAIQRPGASLPVASLVGSPAWGWRFAKQRVSPRDSCNEKPKQAGLTSSAGEQPRTPLQLPCLQRVGGREPGQSRALPFRALTFLRAYLNFQRKRFGFWFTSGPRSPFPRGESFGDLRDSALVAAKRQMGI